MDVSEATTVEEFISDELSRIAMHASMGRDYLSFGDRAGFNFALRSLTARVRSIVDIVNKVGSFEPKGGGA